MAARISILGSCLFIACTTLATLGFGQATDGNIVGTVLDPTNAAIPNAKVDALQVATGARRTTTTNQNGLYRFNNVPIGLYNVTISAKGFATATLAQVQVELNKTTTANLTLQIGQIQQQVVVTEASLPIDTTTAQVSSTYNSQMAVDLPAASNPYQGLGVLNLSLLDAGVASSGGVGVGIGPSVGGQRPRNNNFTIDGVDNNRKDVTGPAVSVNNEAVAEFSILQNQFSAEYGHSSGGQFNIITKSGTNEIHGSIFEYLQNRDLNAVDIAFARQGITKNPRYDQSVLGATIGGPILKNKLFYFGNFTYNPIGQASSPGATIYAPTAAGYQTLAGIPGVSQTNLSVLKEYLPPAATASDTTTVKGVAIPIGIFPVAAPNYLNNYNWLASVDYNMSDRDQWRFRYIDNNQQAIDTFAELPVFFTQQPTLAKLGTMSEYHTFGPTLTNELRLSYSRFNQDVPAGNFKFPGLDSFPNIQIQNDLNVQLGPDPNAPQFTITNNYQIVDNLSWTKGRHTFKFGIDARKLIAPETFIQRIRGDYDYNTLERYVLDLSPDYLAERNVGAAPYSGNQKAFYSFAQDTWQVDSNLSLNLGVRYEFVNVPFSERQQTVNSVADVPGVLTFTQPQPQKHNFVPRIGLAYSPGSSGRTSIRAGFGMAYDTVFDNLGLLSLPPQFTSTVDIEPTANISNFLANGGILPNAPAAQLTPAEARAATSSWIPPLQVLPYSVNWTFGVQHSFAKDYVAEVRYVGTRGVHLFVQSRINRAAPVQPDHSLPTYLQAPSQAALDALPLTLNQLQAETSNFLAQYGFTNNITSFLPQGNSTYHGLAMTLTKRFSHDLTFKGAYTWSHNIDNSTAEVFSTLVTPRRPQDFLNLSEDRSSSALDRRHRFTLGWVYDAPWYRNSSNWFLKNLVGNYMFSGTYTAESPEFGDVQSGVDSNLNGDTAGDRAVLNPAGQDGVGSDVTALKNSRGQIVAYLAQNPNARYIMAGLGVYPNAGRNTLKLRGINDWDMSLAKRFNITERVKFSLRADAYNIFNHPQFTPGQINNVYQTSRTETRNFLLPNNSAFNNPETAFGSNPRTVQVDARISW